MKNVITKPLCVLRASVVKKAIPAFAVILFCLTPVQSKTADSLTVGMKAPPIVLRDISGEYVRLSQFCGKKLYRPWKNKTRYNVVLSFWATYCIPCRKEIPVLEKMMEKYSDSTKVFLVSLDKKGAEIVTPYIKEAGFKSPVLLDMYQKTAEKYGAAKVPSLFLIDKQGIIRYRATGYTGEEQLQEFEKVLREVVGIEN